MSSWLKLTSSTIIYWKLLNISSKVLALFFRKVRDFLILSFLSDLISLLYNLQYIIVDEVNFNQDDIKLIDDKAKKVISDFSTKLSEVDKLSRETLEPIINELIKSNDTNFKGVGQPLRIALTGSKFGPGIYDIIISLGKAEVQRRLINKIIT